MGIRVSDQPFQPVPSPQNTGAAFSANFPNGNPTTLVFTFSASSNPDQLIRWNGSEWEEVAGAVFGAGWVSFTYTSSARGEEHFVVNNGDGTLPVTLSAFNATVTDNDFVQLEWVTQSESNLLGYNIFRAENDANVAQSVRMNATIITAANSPTEHSYSFLDEETEQDIPYHYWLSSVEMDGSTSFFGPVTVTLSGGVGEGGDTPPAVVQPGIHSIYPNPFNPSTTIRFALAEESDVTIEVFDVRGRLVQSHAMGSSPAEEIISWTWDGHDRQGNIAGSGVYMFRLNAGQMTDIRKAMLLK